MTVYYVEILRYGDEKIAYGYGIFNKTKKEIHEMMVQYNTYRGGKYPVYRITKYTLNEAMDFQGEIETIEITEGWLKK